MTILERLTTSLKLSETRAHQHLKASFGRVNGEIVTDPEHEVELADRLTLQPPPITEHV